VINFLKISSSINDETRVKILKFIVLHNEVCVCDIENALDMIQSRISRHLKILKEAGFLSLQRRGKWAYYSIDKKLNSFQEDILKELDNIDLEFNHKILCEKG